MLTTFRPSVQRRTDTPDTGWAPTPDQSLEDRLATAFTEPAHTPVGGFGIVAFLRTLTDRCVDLLDITAADFMLAPRATSSTPPHPKSAPASYAWHRRWRTSRPSASCRSAPFTNTPP
jgi:hypothetical protein